MGDHDLPRRGLAMLVASTLSPCLHLLIPTLVVFLSVPSPPSAAAASLASPTASPSPPGELTALQKHVSFFDRNKDGLIYPWETYQGFRALGFGPAFSSASAAAINGALGPKTRPNQTEKGSPSPLLLPIYVSNIQKGKHGSDTDAYDIEGRFVPEKFEEIFQKHAHTNPDFLTKDELLEMLQANKDPNDVSGQLAARAEWMALYSLAKDKDGLLSKETVSSVYDGSLFYKLEKERNQ